MWQILFFAFPPEIKAPIINKSYKYYDRPVIQKYGKPHKLYKTYK
jgi:hypothetical protein